MENQIITFSIIAIVILFIIFMILRELNCWYWKINRRIELQSQTNELLKKIYLKLGGKIEETAETKQIFGKLESVNGMNLDLLKKLS